MKHLLCLLLLTVPVATGAATVDLVAELPDGTLTHCVYGDGGYDTFLVHIILTVPAGACAQTAVIAVNLGLHFYNNPVDAIAEDWATNTKVMCFDNPINMDPVRTILMDDGILGESHLIGTILFRFDTVGERMNTTDISGDARIATPWLDQIQWQGITPIHVNPPAPGPCGPVPVANSTWGEIKALYESEEQ